MDERRHPRRLGLRPGVDCLQAQGDRAEAARDEGVLRLELRAGLAHDDLEAGERLRRLDLAVVAQLLRLNAEVADDGLQRFLGLLEG